MTRSLRRPPAKSRLSYYLSIFYKPSSKASKSTVIESIVYDKRTRSAKRGLNANSIFWSILRVSHLNSRFCEHTCAPNSFKYNGMINLPSEAKNHGEMPLDLQFAQQVATIM